MKTIEDLMTIAFLEFQDQICKHPPKFLLQQCGIPCEHINDYVVRVPVDMAYLSMQMIVRGEY